MGLYDAAFATVGTLLGREAGPTITGITLFAGFASTVFWSLGSAVIGFTGWRGLMLLYVGIMLCVNLPMVLALVPRLDQNLKAANQAATERTPVSRLTIALPRGVLHAALVHYFGDRRCIYWHCCTASASMRRRRSWLRR